MVVEGLFCLAVSGSRAARPHYRGSKAIVMSGNSFSDQIRTVAEEQQGLIRKARDEERRAADERQKEKARRKVECSTICQRVLLPTVKMFAMGLEAAKVFPPECWKADFESAAADDEYHCICWARLARMEASGKGVGVMIKTTLATVISDEHVVKAKVQVKCSQANPADWKELAIVPGSEPSEGVDATFADNLYELNTAKLDEWHKQRLEDCARACAIWLEHHSGTATLNRLEMEALSLQRFGGSQSHAAR
jgi:hypothetical protein